MLKPLHQKHPVNNAMTPDNGRERDENAVGTVQGESSSIKEKPKDEQHKISSNSIVLVDVDENVDQSSRGNRLLIQDDTRGRGRKTTDHDEQMPQSDVNNTIKNNSEKDDDLTNLDKTQPINDERIKMLNAAEKETGHLIKHDEQIAQIESLQESVQLGDHVYKFCSYAGIPGVIQHHGIVTELNNDTLTVADFDKLIRGESDELKSLFIKRRRGRVYIYEKETSKEWKFVTYKAGWITRSVGRSGTCTAVESDKPGMVLSRVKFLLDKRDKMPSYHVLHANSECVAVWCKTGTWATLQASSLLHTYAAGQVKSASTLAVYVSSQQVAVPSAGLWGYLGYTTKVSLLSTQPYLLPAVAGYGLITIGGPMWILSKCKNIWNKTTETMNHEFWEEALRQPDTFAECMTNWSQL